MTQAADLHPDDLHDRIEERAAIMEFGGHLPRAEAEEKAARLYGFQSWADYLKTTKPSKG